MCVSVCVCVYSYIFFLAGHFILMCCESCTSSRYFNMIACVTCVHLIVLCNLGQSHKTFQELGHAFYSKNVILL